MWQAPALTIAAQAFLLSVLTDRGVSWCARLFILIGGLAAIWAALASLVRLRSREVLYSDAIAYEFDRRGLDDPRPDNLERKALERKGRWHKVDRSVQTWAGRWTMPIYLVWVIALLLFALADVMAFLLTL